MNRRDLFKKSAALGVTAAVPFSGLRALQASSASENDTAKLSPPAEANIPVAFVISDGAVVIDFCGPWEVFQDVHIPERENHMPFQLYTVAETTNPIRTSGGMKVLPSYTFQTAPAPKVIVIPAQNGQSEAMLAWIRKSAKTADVTMSVCTGAFVLASTGLLSGKSATTHHSAYRQLAMDFPDINVKRGVRFVENGNLATAGGLSSGIDLALRVVERYFGTQAAKDTAYQMEYQGQGWTNPNSNEIYAQVRVSTNAHPICPVCEMDVDAATAPHSVYKGTTYYFCSTDHKQMFNGVPQKYLEAAKK